jgi:hypothetical protein
MRLKEKELAVEYYRKRLSLQKAGRASIKTSLTGDHPRPRSWKSTSEGGEILSVSHLFEITSIITTADRYTCYYRLVLELRAWKRLMHADAVQKYSSSCAV